MNTAPDRRAARCTDGTSHLMDETCDAPAVTASGCFETTLRPFAHHRDRDGGALEEPCALCGRTVRHGLTRFDCHVIDGGARFATVFESAALAALLPESDPGDMGCFPVCTDDARKLVAHGFYVFPRYA